jgi:hypothetical protein
MIDQQKRRQALAAVLGAWRNFGNYAFRVDPRGHHRAPLKWAETLGWCWWPEDDRCALTREGVAEALQYQGGD